MTLQTVETVASSRAQKKKTKQRSKSNETSRGRIEGETSRFETRDEKYNRQGLKF